jgi:hypothetical protein
MIERETSGTQTLAEPDTKNGSSLAALAPMVASFFQSFVKVHFKNNHIMQGENFGNH